MAFLRHRSFITLFYFEEIAIQTEKLVHFFLNWAHTIAITITDGHSDRIPARISCRLVFNLYHMGFYLRFAHYHFLLVYLFLFTDSFIYCNVQPFMSLIRLPLFTRLIVMPVSKVVTLAAIHFFVCSDFFLSISFYHFNKFAR